MYMNSAEIVAIIMVLLFYFVILGGVWVLTNFGLYRMAKHAGIPKAWLALVPIGNAWIIGLLAERSVYTYTQRPRHLARWVTILQAVPLVSLVLVIALALADSDFNALVGLSLFLLIIGGLVGAVLYYYALYYIFKDYSPDNAILFFLLGLFFGIYWIFLLVEMNTVPVSVTGFGVFPYGRPKYDRFHQWSPGPAPGPGYPPPAYGPQSTTYTTNPGQQPGGYPQQPYTTNPGQPYQGPQPPYQQGGSYSGQGQTFYQGQGGYYQPPVQQPYDPSRSFPSGGYDPKNPQNPAPPSERPRDEGGNRNGPEL